jgi:predicted phage gp36 major capsid-like protein
VADDDRAVMDKLAALEAEVKADADAQRARKDAALAKLRAQRAAEQAEKDELRRGQQAIVVAKSPRRANVDDFGSALELAGKANRVKAELTKKPAKGEKSWIASGVASMALGPLGWLYAGSLREAVPAAAGWVLLMTIAAKILPMVLLMPVLMVALPLSGIAGVIYALQYNRKGARQRLFGDDKKQLPPGE